MDRNNLSNGYKISKEENDTEFDKEDSSLSSDSDYFIDVCFLYYFKIFYDFFFPCFFFLFF